MLDQGIHLVLSPFVHVLSQEFLLIKHFRGTRRIDVDPTASRSVVLEYNHVVVSTNFGSRVCNTGHADGDSGGFGSKGEGNIQKQGILFVVLDFSSAKLGLGH